jgi:hypothetical protein
MDSSNRHEQSEWIGQLILAIIPIAILLGVVTFLVAFLINR